MSVSSIGLSVLPLHHWLPWCVDSGDASKLDIPLFPSATHRHIRAREPKLARLSPHHYRSLPVPTGHYRSLPVTTPRPTPPASQLGRVPLGHAPCPYPSDNRGNRPAPSVSTAAFLLPCPNGGCNNMSQHVTTHGHGAFDACMGLEISCASRKLILKIPAQKIAQLSCRSPLVARHHAGQVLCTTMYHYTQLTKWPSVPHPSLRKWQHGTSQALWQSNYVMITNNY
jgi:hypothetical protein